MHGATDKIDFRMDHRIVFLFFLGAVVWTLVAFFLGMFVAGGGKSTAIRESLVSLGWLDTHHQHTRHDVPVRVSFVSPSLKKTRSSTPMKKHSTKDVPHPIKGRRRASKKRHKEPNRREKSSKNRFIGQPSKRLALHVSTHVSGSLQNKPSLSQGTQTQPKRKKASKPSKNTTASKRTKAQKSKESHTHKSSPLKKKPNANITSPKNARYTVQFRRFHKGEIVMRIYRKLKKRGYTPLLTKVRDENGHSYYRLRLGYFRTRQQALLFAKNFQTLTNLLGTPQSL